MSSASTRVSPLCADSAHLSNSDIDTIPPLPADTIWLRFMYEGIVMGMRLIGVRSATATFSTGRARII